MANKKELDEMRLIMKQMYKKIEKETPEFKVKEIKTFYKTKINNKLALVMTYIRAGINGPSDWLVTQYQIPHNGSTIQLTLSHRIDDQILWKPILKYVKNSFKISNSP